MYWPEILHTCSLVYLHPALPNKFTPASITRLLRVRNRWQALANMVLYNWTMISVALVFGGVSALRGRSLTPLSQTPIGSNYKDWSAELGEPVVLRSKLLQLFLKLCLRLGSTVGKCAVLLEHIMTCSATPSIIIVSIRWMFALALTLRPTSKKNEDMTSPSLKMAPFLWVFLSTKYRHGRHK